MFVAIALLACLPPQNSSPPQVTGQLTVTAIVKSSSTLVFEPDGTVTLIIANAPGDAAWLAAATQRNQDSVQAPPKQHQTKPHGANFRKESTK